MKNAKTKVQFEKAVKAATTPELLAYYNEKTGKDTKRFSSRTDAEKRCLALFGVSNSLFADSAPADVQAAVEESPTDTDVYVEIVETATKVVVKRMGPMSPNAAKKTKAGAEINLNRKAYHVKITEGDLTDTGRRRDERRQDDRRERLTTPVEVVVLPEKALKTIAPTHANRSAAIKKSWEDHDVKEKRATRHNVKVKGVDYRSVRDAFVALNLPLKDHIKFRMELKSKGEATYDGLKFTAEER